MPKPLLTGEIPSLHDNLAITWRIYQPVRPRGDIGAIVAHPYAPLGGSFDDPVVALVGDAMLEAGLVVGTFNFRGAGDSDGRTSWSGKPELVDYVSFARFFLHYMLHFSKAYDVSQPPEAPNRKVLNIILGGYSYGSMITQQVLPAGDILKQFSNLATSTEKAVDFLWTCEKEIERLGGNLPSGFGIQKLEDRRIQSHYLLISPLMSPVTFSLAPFSGWLSGQSAQQDDELHLIKCPTLAVFGGKDCFTSGKRLRQWAEKLKQRKDSNFRYEEIFDAGHFWREPGVASKLQDVVHKWIQDVVTASEQSVA